MNNMKGGENMESTIEAYSDIMKVKEQESFYKSKGEDVPVPASSVTEAKENLKRSESELYRKN